MVKEVDMIPLIENYFHDLGYCTFTEVSVGGAGHGIADVVAVKFNPEKVLQRIENQQHRSLNTEVLIELLRLISHGDRGTKLSYLESKFSYSRSHLKGNLLNELIKGHFIEETESEKYRKINNIVPLTAEVVAIEAKKEAWKSATQQARRYQTYANKVYVALLEEFTHRVNKDRLLKNNIGLLSVNMDKKKVKPLWKSRKRKAVNSVTNSLAQEAIWERIRFDYKAYIN